MLKEKGYIFFWLQEIIDKHIYGFSLRGKDLKILKEGIKIIDMMLKGEKINNNLKLTKNAVDATEAYFLAEKIYQGMRVKEIKGVPEFLEITKDTLRKLTQGEKEGTDINIMKKFFEGMEKECLEENAENIEFGRINQ